MFTLHSFSRFWRLGAALLAMGAGAWISHAQPLFDAFDPIANGDVYAVVVQPDGRIVLGGNFTQLRPNGFGAEIPQAHIARVNADGSVDATFTIACDDDVHAVALQPDGKIVIGGKFSHVGGVARNGLARLNADGTLDATFDPHPKLSATQENNLPYAPVPIVRAFAIQPNGQIVVGGAFTGFDQAGAFVARDRIARLNADGTLDAAFTASLDNVVYAVELRADGHLLVGGGFRNYRTVAGATAFTAKPFLAQLNPDGTLDAAFLTQPNNRVLAIREAVDGRVVIGGEFTTLTVGSTTTTRTFAARLLATGVVDTVYNPAPNAAVEAISIQVDGKIILGGRFTSFQPNGLSQVFRSYIVRTLSDGDIDENFVVTPNAAVVAIALQTDNSILLGGYFSTTGTGFGTQATRGHIARVESDGLLETLFTPQTGGRVRHVLRDSAGNVILIGSFSNLGGATRNNIVRLGPNGELDANFNPRVNGVITTAAIQTVANTEYLLISGSFSTVNDVARSYLARVKLADGNLDESFAPQPNYPANAMLVQSDGKVIIGGGFTGFKALGATEMTSRLYLARLTSAGALDDTFQADLNGAVQALVANGDGFIVGGEFTGVTPKGSKSQVFRRYLARITGDGVVDPNFDPRPNGPVNVLAAQADGMILLGGQFTGLIPAAKTPVASNRRYLARLSTDWQVDPTFDPSPNAPVYALAFVATDNSIVAGGGFSEIQPGLGSYDSTDSTAVEPTIYSANGMVWLQANGQRVAGRTYAADNTVWSLVPIENGRVLVAGDFSVLFDQPATGTAIRASQAADDHVARLAADGTPDASFQPSGGTVAGEANALISIQNGFTLVGGSFENLSGTGNTNLTRLSSSGAPDQGFGSKIEGPVHALYLRAAGDESNTTGPLAWLTPTGTLKTEAIAATSKLTGHITVIFPLANGRWLLGGVFTNDAGTTSGNLVVLKPDGTIETTFNSGVKGSVIALARDSSDRILVGGEFTEVMGSARKNLARISGLYAGGGTPTLDALDVQPNAVVYTILPAAQGAFYIGGGFSSIVPAGQTTSTNRSALAKISADGAVDATFVPVIVGASNTAVYTIFPQGTDRLLIGGPFTQVNTVAHGGIALINVTDGAADPEFTLNLGNSSTGSSGSILQFVSQGESFLAAGSFFQTYDTTTSDPANHNNLVRFSVSSTGAATIDQAFKPSIGALVRSVAVQPDGKFLIGGDFTSVSNIDGTNVTIRRFVARFNANGTIDDTFNPQPNSSVYVVRAAEDGSILLGGTLTTVFPEALIMAGGDFTNIGSAPFNYLARFNNDGSADTTYKPTVGGPVRALAGLRDDGLLAGGLVTADNTGWVSRFTSASDLLPASTVTADGPVQTFSLLPDGQSYFVGGSFATIAGAAHANVARVALDGTAFSGFNAATNGAVSTVVVQPDGKVLLAGTFTTVNGAAQPYLARVNADGTSDSAFAPVIDGSVAAIALQSDGGMLIGGTFTHVGGVARDRYARLTATGALDATVNVSFNGEVRAINLLPDGRTMVGGRFSQAGGRSRHLVTRLPSALGASQTVAVNAARTSITWTNAGARPEFSNVRFAISTDLSTWTDLGYAARAGTGTWQLAVPAMPADQLYYIRAQMIVPSSRYYSTSRYETMWQFLNDRIAGPRAIGALEGGSSGGAGGGGGSSGGGGGSGGTGGSGGSGGSGGAGGSGGTGGGGGSTGSDTAAYHLINFSVRAQPNTSDRLITGFVIRAAASEKVVLRAVGPGLTGFHVPGAMPAPLLELHAEDGSLVSSATAWNGDGALAQAFTDVGAFALDPTDADAALAPVLAPGVYTTHVAPSDGTNGIALAEVYFAGSSENTGGLANLSARGPAGEGDAVLIIGFVIGGDQSRRFLVRGVGPGLVPYHVPDALVDPSLQVYDANGAIVAANDDWETQAVGTAADITAAQTASSAFALGAGSKDAALVLTLAPGLYTAHIAGTAAGTGLVEVYELP